MEGTFLDLTEENLAEQHLCCIIRSQKPHPGVEEKRRWLADRLKEGHVFRKLDKKATVFLEYAPLEKAWVPVVGENYLYIYCLWVLGEEKGKGYGSALMESCLAEARAQGKSGVCMLGARKQKAWLSDRSFAERFGFAPADRAGEDYELLALSFDGSLPSFGENARRMEIPEQELTVFYTPQCPYLYQSLKLTREFCGERGLPLSLRPVDTLEQAKTLPCVLNNCAVFYKGKFVTVNLPDRSLLQRLLK